jgi:signal transduction histidine kinase
LGVLSFYTKEEHRFAAEEMNFLTALVNQAAIAIYNSHLFEQMRNQAIQLEKSNKIKDEFLGVMSHELRTPLNVIMNYAEALRMGTFGNISREQEKSTEKIRCQAGHLLILINGILEITKIESGTLTLLKDRIDLSEFMTENRSDYMTPTDKDLILQWEFSDLPVITGDRMKLKQILTNLINNAIKLADHGHVSISAQMIKLNALSNSKSDNLFWYARRLTPFIFDKFARSTARPPAIIRAPGWVFILLRPSSSC